VRGDGISDKIRPIKICGVAKATSSGPKEPILPKPKVVMNPGSSTSTHVLSGWKDIANYLGKGVRTVQRYEADLGLPVRRPAGRVRGSVVATKLELDAWVAASPVREEFQAIMPADPLCAVSCKAVREGIREMRTLQAQMRSLRADMRRSISSLQTNLNALHGGMTQKCYYFVSVPSTVDPISPANVILDLLGDFGLPKAS
jgi:hypothetical protein